jgi:hypothetical protein
VSENVSNSKVENVVYAPRKPVTSKSRNVSFPSNFVIAKPIRNEPVIFIRNVANGKGENVFAKKKTQTISCDCPDSTTNRNTDNFC